MKLYVLALALPLLTACMSMKNIKELPPELVYQPPVSGATATIMGKMEPRHTALVGDRIAYIMEIDGKRVPKEKKEVYSDTWDTVYPLTTGEHTVTITYRMAGHYTQPNKISFTAEANKNYQLDFVTDIGTAWLSKDSYADIWIKDKATGQPVTEVVRTAPPPVPRTISYPVIINNR
ncbi:hypothetical protein [uncultured Psychrobacter sp.]|uniref:hypothetical protein n=1 Tax=uncultured Psychrobacter sp. TaxID=259303 RepID=UPI00345AC88F